MPPAPLPPTEWARLAALHSYNVLDTASEAAFDELVALAAELTKSPIALVSLVDAERQWFKARCGLPVQETPRDLAFCAHAILTPDQVLMVADATEDSRFADNPLVTGSPDIRAYIGIPLVDRDGHALGTLCAIDNVPRHHDELAVRTMQTLARAVVANLELRRAFHTSARQASTDQMTGLANRKTIIEVITAAVTAQEPLAVIAIDLDHFKETNDAAGHAAGDALLRAAGKRMQEIVRSNDVVGRIGGDEFVILLRGELDKTRAGLVAERIRVALHLPVSHGNGMLRLGATLGVALVPGDAETGEFALRVADEALVRTKRSGRGRVGWACREDGTRAAREAVVIRSLHQLAHGALPGLTAHFQPIVDLRSGVIVAVEALARWECGELGQVPPDEFFSVAARIGLAAQLSEVARDQALAGYVRLRREGLKVGRLALNFSAAELLQEGVVLQLERQCADLGLDLDAVTIEITEDALLARVASTTISRLVALRGSGAKIALDDFGIGTSGLAQLLRMPLDELKLDRTFTRNLGMDGRAERIVEGTIRLADSMGMSVVAEGIEDETQARKLRDLGCNLGQGWLYARAMSEDDLRDWLSARQRDAGRVIPLKRAVRAASLLNESLGIPEMGGF